MPQAIAPGYYWFTPKEGLGHTGMPVEVRTLDPKDRLAQDHNKNFDLAVFTIGHGWYMPLEEFLQTGSLTSLVKP